MAPLITARQHLLYMYEDREIQEKERNALIYQFISQTISEEKRSTY